MKPISYDLILLIWVDQIVRRQTCQQQWSLSLRDLNNGYYDLVVELENNEIARIRVEITSPRVNTDFRQDITLEWKAPFKCSSETHLCIGSRLLQAFISQPKAV